MMKDQLSCLTNCSLLNLSTCQLLPHPFEINLVSYKTKGEVKKSVTGHYVSEKLNFEVIS